MEGLHGFLQALKGIPNDEKRAYLMALAKAPHLLHRESCIDRFLRCDPNQADKVARKFVDYWEKRKQVFDHATFQPLALSEPWTLSESCKSLLLSGWISPLPADKSGRRVCLLNLSVEQGQRHILHEDKARCIFFVLQCLSEDKSAQKEGISLLILYEDTPHTSQSASIKTLDEILQVFPIRVGSLYVVYSGDNDRQASFYENVVPVTLKTLLNSPVDGDQNALLEQRSHIYVGQSRERTLQELERDGLRRESLPSILGGSWDAVLHEAWLKVRQQDEVRDLSKAQSLGAFSFPGTEATTGGETSVDVREKIRDAWHSKLKRTRKRCRTKALQIHLTYLREQQRKTKEANKKLEQALEEANRIVAIIESNHPVGSPLAGMILKPAPTPTPVACPSMASLHLQPSWLGFTSMPSGTLSMAIRAEREVIRAERERLLLAAMATPRALPVLPFSIGNPDVYHGVTHHPVLYAASLNEVTSARRLSLTRAIAQAGVAQRHHEWNPRYF